MDLGLRGRGLVATQPIMAGELIVECSPMAAVVKSGKAPAGMSACKHCFALTPSDAERSPALCSSVCIAAFDAGPGSLLERVDLSQLQELHQSQGRKFPLLIAQLLAGLLAQIKSGNVPKTWAPLELCFAELEPEAMRQIATEHEALCQAFEAADLTNSSTLQMLLPLSRYAQLLGAAQLNAFELQLSTGFAISCLLTPTASCFNHSCNPNVLVACGDSARNVAFVAGVDIDSGCELCISYVDTEARWEDRRRLLLHKYGFECSCGRCERGKRGET